MSLSSRRAWIEIMLEVNNPLNWNCRSPHGERGLKFYSYLRILLMIFESLSSRRAWIEIPLLATVLTPVLVSLSSRRAWIEIEYFATYGGLGRCRSPHGERGLKSQKVNLRAQVSGVALLTESVDWNCVSYWYPIRQCNVALLTESVDWNLNKEIVHLRK